MDITINELDQSNVGHINQCDGTFTVDAVLRLHAQDSEISYAIASVPRYEKRFPQDEIDYTTYIGDPDKTAFLAYVDERIAGQIILHRHWNKYAYVEDIAVDIKFRRLGIGTMLMRRAVVWTTSKGLAGIMLEAQNNNVASAQFYERFGFKLGGFDRYLYKGLTPETDEIALYWYYFLP